MRLLRKILFIPIMTILFADPPNWQDDPGAYEFTATIAGAIIMNESYQMGDDGDILGAFDDSGNVRGIGTMLFPPFGPYAGSPVFEVQLRSNDASDELSFRYYDASADAILNIVETYEFIINDYIGNVENPLEFNLVVEFVTLTLKNVSSTSIVDINYESNTEISGFQFDVTGATLISVYGGDAETQGFMISAGSFTVLGFSLSGATIPSGSGTLLSLEIGSSSEYQSLDLDNVLISGPNGHPIPNSVVMLPQLFEYNQSTLQAFYYFTLVLINDINVESSDWVGAFNGDVCVGARAWETSLCGNGVCEVPVMGDDGSELTEGYMTVGNIPTFKIYDASENLYYNAESSENLGWINYAMLFSEILTAIVPGCTDPSDCNYNPLATENDGSCDPSDESCLGCTDGDACNINFSATIDNGSCYYAEENYDCDGNCTAEVDCAGDCGGLAKIDLCGACDNYIATNGSQPDFPYGDCDCLGNNGGNASNDNCGECDDNATNDCTEDCNNIWGGSAIVDNCGQCDDNATNDCVQDCSGAWGGDLVIDECGICNGPGSTSDCGCSDIPTGFCDCEGNELDECGICNGDNSTCLDCNDVPNGDNQDDMCGHCDNDISNDCVQDCFGNWGGNKVIDNCGICDNDITNDCVQDCAGIWGGTAEIDECEICNGDGPDENYDCEGNCIAEIDCQGICGGFNIPTFVCQNACVVCNPADCNNLDSNCNSMDISFYLLPNEFGISKIFPNPFNPVTQIQYELVQFGLISINIYDIQGRVVDQLMNEYQSPGHYDLNWNAGNNASGMYIVEMVMELENNEVYRDLQKILYLK